MLLKNIGQLVTFDASEQGVVTHSNVDLSVKGGIIETIGKDLKTTGKSINCTNRLVTPGFVDPHTHPVFFDGREEEYLQRLAGVSYEEIARQGGGIRSSIEGVRNASEKELTERVEKRMDRFLRLGTTTVEAKSGYGLNLESELKSLHVLENVNQSHPIDIVPTFLGAHAVPPEFENEPDLYVELISKEMIPAVAEQKLARYCDVFCEEGYFNPTHSKKILERGQEFGLIPRLHADEFVDSGAAALAAEVGAVSADHLMAVSDAGLKALADGGVIATLLPGTTFFLGKQRYAPARKLLDQNVTVALATDFNPGSSHIQSMPFIIHLSCSYLGMTVEEAFAAATYHAARTLHLEHRIGSLEEGKQADIVIWDLERLVEIPYYVSDHPIYGILKRGELFRFN
jgi:imidazolonepropionase